MTAANLAGHFLKLLAMGGRISGKELSGVKNNHASTGRFYLVAKYFELGPHTERGDFTFNQALGALRQCLLHFANTNRQHAALAQAFFNGQLGKEM